VSGCSIPAANGVYKQCGFCDDVPKYIKNAKKNGPHVAFMIYRCKVGEESRTWYISIVAPNSKPTSWTFISVSLEEKLFTHFHVYALNLTVAVCYSAKNRGPKPDRSPPTGGWLDIATQEYESSLKVIHGF
jgi:hypothetical protein